MQKFLYSPKPSVATEQIDATPTPWENPSSPSFSTPNDSRIFSKIHDDLRIDQIENLIAEVAALKSFIMEQHYNIKNSVEDFR